MNPGAKRRIRKQLRQVRDRHNWAYQYANDSSYKSRPDEKHLGVSCRDDCAGHKTRLG
jgi:hypothetical protein